METTNKAEFSYCNTVGQTDVGKKRKANEDHGGHFETINGLVSVVCDGMGGHVGGAVASEVAVRTIHSFLDSKFIEDPREAIGLAIDAANKAIIRQAEQNPDLEGMGSTCVLLIVREGRVYIGHVGDSRIYLIREKTIIQLTKDHSFVQTLVDIGQITKEQAEHHPRKNEITNALGLSDMSPATVREDAIEPQVGDCFLLCSDGLSGMVSEHDIEKIISRQRDFSSQQRADLLVQAANNNGGVDNITVELVEFTITPDLPKANSSGKKKWFKVVIPAICVFFAICLVFLLFKYQKHVTNRTIMPDLEESAMIQITRMSRNNVYRVRLLPQAIDYIIEDKITFGDIETNMAIRDINEGIELFIPDSFVSDSAFFIIYGKKSDYRYSAKINSSAALKTVVLSEVAFKSHAKIGTIYKDSHSIQIAIEGSGTTISIDDVQSDINVTPSEVISQTNDYKIVLQFLKVFTEDEIVLSFKTSEGECKYIIPIVRGSSNAGGDFLEDLLRPKTDEETTTVDKSQESCEEMADTTKKAEEAKQKPIKTFSYSELVPIEEKPILVISEGRFITYRTSLGTKKLPVAELIENGISFSDSRMNMTYDNDEYIITVANPKSGENFLVTILGKDNNGGQVKILFQLKYE